MSTGSRRGSTSSTTRKTGRAARDAYLRLTQHGADGDIAIDVDPRPLDQVADACERQRQPAGGPKMVLIP